MKWIRIKDQKPPLLERVLVYSPKQEIHTAIFFEDGFYNAFITHWMPLPETPKETK